MPLIQLNGASGGGQMLRSALSLAMITGQPFRMVNIRGQRPKPGLMRQHLTCVNAACEISGGVADGAEIGSTELVFQAGTIKSGAYEFAIGTAGSTTLLLQTLLPALWVADGNSTLTLNGGTHNPFAPPFDFIERVFLPAAAKFGAHADVTLLETGFAPAGGGKLTCKIFGDTVFNPADFSERGAGVATRATIIHRNLPDGVPVRLSKAFSTQWPETEVSIVPLDPSGPGRGGICLLEVETAGHLEMFTSHGEQGVASERVVSKAIKPAKDYLGSGAGVSIHLADQLLIPMALAKGGKFSSLKLSNHIKTNIEIIQAFLPVRFDVDDKRRLQVSIT